MQGGGDDGEGDGEGLRAEAGAVAAGALRRGHEAHHVLAVGLGLRLLHVVAEVAEDPVEAEACALAARRAVQQEILLFLGQIFKWLLEVDPELFSDKLYCPKKIMRG